MSTCIGMAGSLGSNHNYISQCVAALVEFMKYCPVNKTISVLCECCIRTSMYSNRIIA